MITNQDCYCGAVGCRRKLGVKPNKPKMPSSDAALKLVARQVYQNGALHGGMDILRRNNNNCIGEVVRILHSEPKRSFGIIKRFDNFSKKHSIMFEDGSVELIDMSKEEWEFCSFIL